MNQNLLGRALRLARQYHDDDARACADKLGISLTCLERIESGEELPSAALCDWADKVYGVDLRVITIAPLPVAGLTLAILELIQREAIRGC